MDWDSFFAVHSDLPREGPGSPEDVAWAVELAILPDDPSLCDVGAGPGGDVAALLAAAPRAAVTAVENHPGFVAQMQARFAGNLCVTVVEGRMEQAADMPGAPFDLIWSAGALYFLGLEAGPRIMAGALKPGGVLAFSEPCFFTETPSEAARAFWEGYPTRNEAGIRAAAEAAGFTVLGARPVSDDGWEAYYGPMEARIAALRPTADARLTEMLDASAAEAETWRAVRGETGYLLVVARRT